jgi:hypothetical protein
LSHETFNEPIVMDLSVHTATAEMLFDELRLQCGTTASLRLVLDRDLVLGFRCEQCDAWREILRPASRVMHTEAVCPQCNANGRPEMTHTVDADSTLAKKTLQQLGVPRNDIVRIQLDNEEVHILLTGDLIE